MPENRPSKKQKELLSFIDGFIKDNGYGPSYREIMRALELKSVSTVATHVDGLVARGYLRKNKNSARSLEVLSPDGIVPAPAQQAAPESVRQEIEKAIEKLQGAGTEEGVEAVEVLKRALEILGYESVDASTK